MVQIPDWVQDTIFYQIFPDRFAKSDRVPKPGNLEAWDSRPTVYGFKGGDLLGVTEHLDYLQELGITAIYFTPIFQSTANHRYHTHDYYRVDPILGGDAAFSELLQAARARNIRVIIDGVFNHASRGFYQFNHILENGAASPYVNWFNIRGYPLHAYEGKPVNYDAWWGIPALPKMNTNLRAVREFIFGVAEHWIRLGVNGWRLDVPAEIDDDSFWQEFRRRVKTANADSYIVGEIWHEAQRWLQGDQFDAVMNYQFTRACIGFFIGENTDESLTTNVGFQTYPSLDASGFAYTINHLLSLYDRAITNAQMNLLDSHDTARFISIAKGDQSALRLATLFQMTYPGAPSVYYADEIGMPGGKDPDCRRTFPWDSPGQWDTSLLQYFKDCIALRKRYTALRYGEFRFVYAEERTIAYLRSLDDQRFVVVINAGAETTINIVIHPEFGLPEGTSLTSLADPKTVYVVKNGQLSVHIGKREGVVLMAQPQTPVKTP